MDGLTRAKMVMALITPDIIEEWNAAVSAFKLYFILDYTTHTPILFIGSPDIPPEPWLIFNTRTKMHTNVTPRNEHLRAGAKDLKERLEKHKAALFIKHSRNKQKQQFAGLGITADAAGMVTTVLHTIKKGTSKEYIHFALNDRW